MPDRKLHSLQKCMPKYDRVCANENIFRLILKKKERNLVEHNDVKYERRWFGTLDNFVVQLFFLCFSLHSGRAHHKIYFVCKQIVVSIIFAVMFLEPNDIKNILLNTDKPCVIKNLDLNWECLKSMNLTQWCTNLEKSFDEGIPFEVANIKHNKYPQWERHRQLCRMTMEEYMNKFHLTDNPKEWATFSYKSLNMLPKTCRNGVNFERFGFPDMEYINFWFGSKGAHTSTHFDSYGCNIVVQVYGR